LYWLPIIDTREAPSAPKIQEPLTHDKRPEATPHDEVAWRIPHGSRSQNQLMRTQPKRLTYLRTTDLAARRIPMVSWIHNFGEGVLAREEWHV
jgi:hypothetical protein